jgi:protein tyrosine phosphatase (PTP) superfamily phosphohydrolase (DUF442 family)
VVDAFAELWLFSSIAWNGKEGTLATTSTSNEIDSRQSRRSPFRVFSWRTGATVVLVCAIGLSWIFRKPWFLGNLAVVDPGQVMRSAQPTTQLTDWAREYELKSVINLRGGGPADWWYSQEIRSTQETGVTFYDLPLSATRRPTRRELLQLIDLLNRCPYPLLIHCKSGADRTGLVSALYRMVRRGEPPESALEAFSIEFGHIPLFGTEHLHEPLQEYAAWLTSNQLAHEPDRFRTWVRNEYRAADPPADPAAIGPGPRARRSSTGQAASLQ